MRKLIKGINILTLAAVPTTPMLFISSCKLNYCVHEPGELVSLFNSFRSGAIYKCKKCGCEFSWENPEPEMINMPVIYINGDFSKVTKENKEKMTCKYSNPFLNQEFEADCTVKWQGNSSVAYPKKNYNIVFYKKDEKYETKQKVLLNNNWTSESKYTLKAHYLDCSFLRNNVCATVIGSGIKLDASDELGKTVNGGCQDGFPVILYENNIFNGIYILDIPKDQQLYKSIDGKVKPKYILSANNWLETALMFKPIDGTWTDGIEKEYCSGDEATMVQSFNNLVNFGLNNDGEAFKNGINNYFDLNRSIDYIVFMQAFGLADNAGKNANFVSFDGTKWMPTLYDMDSSFGLPPWGAQIKQLLAPANNILAKIYNLYKNEIKAKYLSYRNNVLKLDYIYSVIDNFDGKITKLSRDSDKKQWIDYPNKECMPINYLKTYIKARLEWLDDNW